MRSVWRSPARGIVVRDGTWSLNDLERPPTAQRRTIASRRSPPLSTLAGYFMKVSQNFYTETLLRTFGRQSTGSGSADAARSAARAALVAWGIPPDSFVMDDGSGLSRYDYATAHSIVALLEHVWHDERLRGPFLASLPVAGHDGTLASRMTSTPLDARVQAKTGTLSNVRALSGYLETASGERLAFSMIANNFTAAGTAVNAIFEQALERLERDATVGH